MAEAFEAFEEAAAYVPADRTRSQALTEGRDTAISLAQDYDRQDLRVVRVYMHAIDGDAAMAFFEDEHDSGWIECHRNDDGAVPMWKVEPK